MAGTREPPHLTPEEVQAALDEIERLRRAIVNEANEHSGYGGEAGSDEERIKPSAEEDAVPRVREPRPYRHTPRQYLVRERRAEYRSEYIDGEIVAMAGATERHATIAQNIAAHLYFRVGGRCRLYQSDLKVRVQHGSGFAYPDVMVLCGEPRFAEGARDVVANPTIVFEVLSPGTERRDRGVKARAYRAVETLQAYVLVSQQEPRVELYVRDADGEWPCAIFQRLDDAVLLAAAGCSLTLAEIYRNVVFAEAPR